MHRPGDRQAHLLQYNSFPSDTTEHEATNNRADIFLWCHKMQRRRMAHDYLYCPHAMASRSCGMHFHLSVSHIIAAHGKQRSSPCACDTLCYPPLRSRKVVSTGFALTSISNVEIRKANNNQTYFQLANKLLMSHSRASHPVVLSRRAAICFSATRC